MTIIGIDPGSRRIGYGVIEKAGSKLSLLASGILPIKGTTDAKALSETKVEVDRLLETFKPTLLGIEKLYVVRNKTTGTQTAQARGVILLSATEHGVLIKEFTPNEVKAGITGYGLADKKAVAKMVAATLGPRVLNEIDDATDALAIALLVSYQAASRRP